jgi:hypothetical protein
MIRTNVLSLKLVAPLLSLFAAGPVAALAGPLTNGNILVSDEQSGASGRVREFTSSGVLVQTFTYTASDQSRDLMVDQNGNIQIYDGTFTPFLTGIKPLTGTTINNYTTAGWSTVNNITYGGVAAFRNYVFATDMMTNNDGGTNGIIRFDINTGTATRFGSGTVNGPGDYIQITEGKNGYLYAQFPGTSPGGNKLDVYDPSTLAFQRRISLGIDLRSVAVDQNGNIFAVAFNDTKIYEFDTNGNMVRSLNPNVGGFTDINIDANGRLVASLGDKFLLSDTNLTSFSVFNVGTTGLTSFVAFVESPMEVVPEPGSLTFITLGASVLFGYARRRRSLLQAGAMTKVN